MRSRDRFERAPWGVRVHARGRPRTRLLWLYHAGGTASAVASGIPDWPEDWEILIPDYPGRGVHSAIGTLPTIEAIADHVTVTLSSLSADVPVVVFGHSMGGLVGCELLSRAPAATTRAVAAFVVSAVRAPTWFAADRHRAHASDDEIISRMLAIGGTPREVLDDPTVREFILSNLRDDLRTIDRYVHDDARVLDIPIVAFGGARDPIAAGDDLRAWRRATRGTFDYREFAGGHFYHLEDPTMFVDALREATEAILGYC